MLRVVQKMIKETKFSNLMLNTSFYITSFEQFYIKTGLTEYLNDDKIVTQIEENQTVFCDEERMIEKPEPPQKERKSLFW